MQQVPTYNLTKTAAFDFRKAWEDAKPILTEWYKNNKSWFRPLAGASALGSIGGLFGGWKAALPMAAIGAAGGHYWDDIMGWYNKYSKPQQEKKEPVKADNIRDTVLNRLVSAPRNVFTGDFLHEHDQDLADAEKSKALDSLYIDGTTLAKRDVKAFNPSYISTLDKQFDDSIEKLYPNYVTQGNVMDNIRRSNESLMRRMGLR